MREKFQSAPAIAGGRCSANLSQSHSPASFNPRPPLLAGDATSIPSVDTASGVSIRARHCWRAMPAARAALSALAMFQSAPAIAGGRCVAAACRAIVATQFQSAPAIAGGRCATACSRSSVHHCFNPRPPLLAGDAYLRALGRAFPARFQSAPAIAGGRCVVAPRTIFKTCMFQSAPAIAGGRCPAAIATWCARSALFQSAPAIAGGRCYQHPGRHCRLRRFNPRPPLLAGDA